MKESHVFAVRAALDRRGRLRDELRYAGTPSLSNVSLNGIPFTTRMSDDDKVELSVILRGAVQRDLDENTRELADLGIEIEAEPEPASEIEE